MFFVFNVVVLVVLRPGSNVHCIHGFPLLKHHGQKAGQKYGQNSVRHIDRKQCEKHVKLCEKLALMEFIMLHQGILNMSED